MLVRPRFGPMLVITTLLPFTPASQHSAMFETAFTVELEISEFVTNEPVSSAFSASTNAVKLKRVACRSARRPMTCVREPNDS